jgi:hypothetical protein
MYRCDSCKKVSSPRQGLNKVTLQTRRAVYKDLTGRIVGEGNEIVREIGVCALCFDDHNSALVESFLHKQVDKALRRGL